VNEIRPALAGTSFVLIWRRRDPAADDLARNMPTHASVRQGVHHFGNASGKLPQTIGELLGCHASMDYIANDQFSMANFQSVSFLEPCPNQSSA